MAAVFVIQDATAGQLGPVAGYLSTAGWASAAARILGDAWVVCPTGTIDPAEALRRGTAPGTPGPGADDLRARAARAVRATTPEPIKTLVKDLRQHRRAQAFRIDPDGPWRDHEIDFVWQRHGLFHTGGLELAEALGRPSVLFVPATKVWEAERWGTRRPGWGPLVERRGERPALTRADVVACGSPEVAEQAVRLGATPERVVITPTGVDLARFPEERPGRDRLRADLGLTDRFVVGWVGSFRPFHALDRAVEALRGIPDAALLLVGDGPERAGIEALARERGVAAVFTGTVAPADLPAHLAAMDVGLVLAPGDEGFHYSPLKLAEYLAGGLPVIAPAVDPIRDRLTHDVDAVLVDPGDPGALRTAIAELRDDPDRRHRIAAAARVAAQAGWSWDHQIHRVLDALGTGGGDPSKLDG